MGGRARTAIALRSNLELEGVVAEDPYDDGRWLVLEDWLLEQEDARAPLILGEKSGATDDLARERERLAPALFGPEHAQLREVLYALEWRAGFVRECHFATNEARTTLFDAFVAAPATRLLRKLTLSLLSQSTRAITKHLSRAQFTDSLHELTVSTWHRAASGVDAIALGTLRRLRKLALRGVYLASADGLPDLGSLTLAPSGEDTDDFAAFLRQPFPGLEELRIDLDARAARLHDETASLLSPVEIASVIALSPRLVRLELTDANVPTVRLVLETLASSPLAWQLRSLVLGSRQVSPAESHLFDAFDALGELWVPAEFPLA